MLIVPSFYVTAGKLLRLSPFSSADEVMGGTLAEAVRRFLDCTAARVFHVKAIDGVSLACAAEIAAVSSEVEEVLLEGVLLSRTGAEKRRSSVVTPVLEESELLRDPLELDPELGIMVALTGDGEDVFERFARALEQGAWGAVHHSEDPATSLELDRLAGHKMPIYSREPMATPNDVERVVHHHRLLHHGGHRRVIVDAEWYVDINTFEKPFDLLKPDAPRVLHQVIKSKG